VLLLETNNDMRQIRLVFLFVMLTQWSVAQTTYTANNNPGAVTGVNIFTGATALQDAIAAASAGDIIYVVRSATSYGATTVDKQLTIYGIGLNPDTDGSTRSIVNIIIIADPVATGTRISGLNISNRMELGGVAGALNNLLIENNRIRWIRHVDATTTLANLMIRNNVIGSGSASADTRVDLLAGAIANVVIANNVLYVGLPNNGVITASNGTSIENNLFIGTGADIGTGQARMYSFENFNGNSVKNNIFHRIRPDAFGSFTNNTFENNISFDSGADFFSTANGNTSFNNLTSQDPLITNVGAGDAINYSTFDPTLMVGSPAIGTGVGGIDMGVLGGGSPFDLEGSPLPLVHEINAPPTISQGSDLPINIKGSGN